VGCRECGAHSLAQALCLHLVGGSEVRVLAWVAALPVNVEMKVGVREWQSMDAYTDCAASVEVTVP
jgi:hypothetical protein